MLPCAPARRFGAIALLPRGHVSAGAADAGSRAVATVARMQLCACGDCASAQRKTCAESECLPRGRCTALLCMQLHALGMGLACVLIHIMHTHATCMRCRSRFAAIREWAVRCRAVMGRGGDARTGLTGRASHMEGDLCAGKGAEGRGGDWAARKRQLPAVKGERGGTSDWAAQVKGGVCARKCRK